MSFAGATHLFIARHRLTIKLTLMIRLPLLISLLMLLLGHAAFAQENNGAQLSFTEKVHDFGKVLADSPLNYTFEFTNSGNAPLFITGIEPSCHCVTATWTRGKIAPGAKGTVEVHVTPPHDIRFYRNLWIASNATNYDPALMRYEISVKGEGVKELPKKKTTSRTKNKAHKH
jgi:hypothetical protein